MKCPNCNKEIKQVNVFSQCWQKATVNDKGEISEYGVVEDILETQGIECPNCSTNITDLIKEGV